MSLKYLFSIGILGLAACSGGRGRDPAPASEPPPPEAPPSARPPASEPPPEAPPTFPERTRVVLDDETPPPGCQGEPIVKSSYSVCIDDLWHMETTCYFRCADGPPQAKVCHRIATDQPCTSPPPPVPEDRQLAGVDALPRCIQQERLGSFRNHQCRSGRWELWQSAVILCPLPEPARAWLLHEQLVSVSDVLCPGRPAPPGVPVVPVP